MTSSIINSYPTIKSIAYENYKQTDGYKSLLANLLQRSHMTEREAINFIEAVYLAGYAGAYVEVNRLLDAHGVPKNG